MRQRFPLQGLAEGARKQVQRDASQAARRADPEINAELIDFTPVNGHNNVDRRFQRNHKPKRGNFQCKSARESRAMSRRPAQRRLLRKVNEKQR